MFVPGHITGFFTIYRSQNNKLKTGSTGAGITVNKGVRLGIKKGSGKVYYNNEEVEICIVKKIKEYFKKFGYNINLNHYDIMFSSDFPLGSGLGMSGGCALLLSMKMLNILKNYALNGKYEAHGRDHDYLKIAHISEVECGTGLGDVIAQHVKGFVIRKSPGFPINAKKIFIKNVDEYYIIIDILGKKDTKKVILDKEWINKINKSGEKCLNYLLKYPSLENFVKQSYDFARDTGLMDDTIQSICEDLKFTIGSSQSMLGNTIFCISKKETLNDAISILKNPIVCKIYY